MIIVENKRKLENKEIKIGDVIKSYDGFYFLLCEKRKGLYGFIDLKTSYIYDVDHCSISEMLNKEFEGIEQSYDSNERYTHIPSEEFKLTIY